MYQHQFNIIIIICAILNEYQQNKDETYVVNCAIDDEKKRLL